jgi:hypothetical protein
MYLMTVGLLKAIETQVFDYVMTRLIKVDVIVSFNELESDNGRTFALALEKKLIRVGIKVRDVDQAIGNSHKNAIKSPTEFVGGKERSWFFSRPRTEVGWLSELFLRLVTITTRPIRTRLGYQLVMFVCSLTPSRKWSVPE